MTSGVEPVVRRPPRAVCAVALARLELPLPVPVLDALFSTLDAARQAVLARFRRQVDRERGVLGDVLTRTLVAAVAGIRPSAVRVEREASGRPTVAAVDGIHVSISHAGSWVASAVAQAPIGIDVEAVRPVSRAVLGEAGGASLPVVDAWTAKEAYLKMVGTGLAIDPGAVRLARRNGWLEAAGPRERPRGCVRILVPDRTHRLAVCTSDPPHVIVARTAARALARDYLADTTPFTERINP
jgi:4'-phosphopantetheinyl transferase